MGFAIGYGTNTSMKTRRLSEARYALFILWAEHGIDCPYGSFVELPVPFWKNDDIGSNEWESYIWAVGSFRRGMGW